PLRRPHHCYGFLTGGGGSKPIVSRCADAGRASALDRARTPDDRTDTFATREPTAPREARTTNGPGAWLTCATGLPSTEMSSVLDRSGCGPASISPLTTSTASPAGRVSLA